MVSTPSIPAPVAAPASPTTEEATAETKEQTQAQVAEAERKRKGRAETVLTSTNGSMAGTARKTLLGE